MVLATAEYYDHASLHAAAVYAGDTSSAKREKKYMDEAYEQMGIYQECKQDIDEYISNMGNKNSIKSACCKSKIAVGIFFYIRHAYIKI